MTGTELLPQKEEGLLPTFIPISLTTANFKEVIEFYFVQVGIIESLTNCRV
ncbi:hypothetical protein OGCDGJMD_02410 [Cyanobium usitatum str. Tous]|nr:hypothetical protein OGCDGJMD_02410 [Cyanobium usitatum str. Tous]